MVVVVAVCSGVEISGAIRGGALGNAADGGSNCDGRRSGGSAAPLAREAVRAAPAAAVAPQEKLLRAVAVCASGHGAAVGRLL